MTDLEKLREHKMGIESIRQAEGNKYAVKINASGSRKEKESTLYHYLTFEVVVEELSEVVEKAILIKESILL